MTQIAKDGEVGLVYRIDGESYAVGLTLEQHRMLQLLVPCLGDIKVFKKAKVDYVDENGIPVELP